MRTLDFLRPLVAFPSVSSTSNVEVSRHAEAQLQQLGGRTEWLAYDDRYGVAKACVAARFGPDTGDDRGMAYFCHTDVVPAAGWSGPSASPWDLTVEGDRAFGRGSCDMKGSFACMLAAIETVGAGSLTKPLTVVCTADEEVGMYGAAEVAAKSELFRDCVARQSRAIIGEPTSLQVVHAHKGGRGLSFHATGRAAHSSSADGINANFQMIPFLHQLHQYVQTLEGDSAWQDDRFTPPGITLNLTVNDHNSALNITSAKSDACVYFRTMPKIDGDAIENQLLAFAKDAGLEVKKHVGYVPVFTDPQSEFIQELLQRTRTLESQTVSYGTDGSFFTELTDLAVLGPGSIEQAHTVDEWISLEQLSAGTALYSELIKAWCCG